MEPTV
ncbi:hypothetical protein VCHC47A1_2059, partial [Vibrio cholerae HC-47A1]